MSVGGVGGGRWMLVDEVDVIGGGRSVVLCVDGGGQSVELVVDGGGW